MIGRGPKNLRPYVKANVDNYDGNKLEDIDVKGGTLGLIHIVLGKIEVKLDNISDKIKDIEGLIRDHETRLRNLEKSNYIYYGGFLVINVIVQLVLRKVL